MNIVFTEAQWNNYKLFVDADNKISIQKCGVLIPKFSSEVCYLGDNRFVVEHCENAKMQEGDTFSCLQFSLGRELILTDFHQVATPNTNHHSYIVGTQNGLTTLRFLH